MYGIAFKDRGDGECERSTEYYAGEDLGKSFQVPLDENSEIEEDDGELCEGDEKLVDNLASIPELQKPLALTMMGAWP